MPPPQMRWRQYLFATQLYEGGGAGRPHGGGGVDGGGGDGGRARGSGGSDGEGEAGGGGDGGGDAVPVHQHTRMYWEVEAVSHKVLSVGRLVAIAH